MNQFVLKQDRAAVFLFASQQRPLGQSVIRAHGKDPARLETFYVIADYGSDSPIMLSKSSAVLFVLQTLGGPWRLATVVGVLPTKLLDWVYSLVARNRYRIFGRYDTCPIPRPEYKSRFIDV